MNHSDPVVRAREEMELTTLRGWHDPAPRRSARLREVRRGSVVAIAGAAHGLAGHRDAVWRALDSFWSTV